jgi:hypothetical protein
MFFDQYKLDHYLSLEGVDERLTDIRIKNHFPGLRETLSSYKELLKEYEFSPVIATHGQIYEGEIVFPRGDFYKISWDVGFSQGIIKEFNLRPQMLSIDYLKDAIDPETIEIKHLKKSMKNKEPIIVAGYPLLSGDVKHYILDGNHRVYARYKAAHQGIAGYILSPEHHFYAMASDIHRVLYLVHQAVDSILEFMVGKISRNELDRYLNSLDGYFDGSNSAFKNLLG